MLLPDPRAPPDCQTVQFNPSEAPASERARYREIAAYLSAASILPDVTVGLSPAPCISKDITLNALVQHGALRLDTDRSFLSLIDGDSQYIVAEATRKQSLARQNLTTGEPDSLFLGVCKLEKSFGVCPNTMRAFTDETGTWVTHTANVVCDTTRYIINDFRADPKYLEKPYVSGFPHMVSYLEVPLISPLGYVLGSYCVVDNKPRNFNNEETVEIMTEIASAIMSHLDLVKNKNLRSRSDQLIRGLGEFMEQDFPMQHSVNGTYVTGSSQSTRHTSDVGAFTESLDGTTRSSRGEEALTPSTEARGDLHASMDVYARPLTAEAHATETTEFSFQRPPGFTPPSTPIQVSEQNSVESLSAIIEPQNAMTASSIEDLKKDLKFPSPPTSEPSPDEIRTLQGRKASSASSAAEFHTSPISSDVKNTFFKAATTIREAMGMEGVTFVDAVASGFGSRSVHATPAEQGEDPFTSDSTESGTKDIKAVCCATLSQSTKAASQKALTPALQLSEAVLQRFIRRYPRGHIFTADELGPIDCRYGPGHAMRNIQKSGYGSTRYRKDISKLFEFLPGSRYIIFLPLWHFQRECWYAAIFGHVTDATVAIELADINLLTAFGNSVMVEVSRFEAMAVSRAKSDFISSISHELRSPLHGIMASGELLRDAIADPQLLPLLDMIDSCSTTLLDTFDNLLDFAKINSVVKGLDRSDGGFKRNQKPEMHLVDFSRLVEDVVETVQLGHNSRTAFRPEQEGILTAITELSNAGEDLPDTSVLVTVNIEKRASWMTKLDNGAWKRIIMNLFGNALKYTRSGHIEVSLRMTQISGSKNQSRSHICFSVKDTGIGMSPDYIKYHLFTPFAQENTHSPGTGLGLSIVQQITKGLGGELDVKSQIGVGTVVTVLVPLNGETAGPLSLQLAPIVEGSQMDARHDLRDHSLCCITTEAYQTMSNSECEISSEMRDRACALEVAVRQIAEDLLGMKVIFTTNKEPLPKADVYFFDSHLFSKPIQEKRNLLMPKCLLQAAPMVMLCSGSGPLQASKGEEVKHPIVYVRHPLGPKKLATALLGALKLGKSNPLAATEQAFEPASTPSYFPIREKEEASSQNRSILSESSSSANNNSLLTHSPSTTPSTPYPPNEVASIPLTSTLPSSTLPPLGPASNQLHLLLVDDNPINLKILTTLVKKLSFTFATACNGLEAVHLFQASLHPSQRLFDIVFMDISMPVMNGFEATREIRRIERENGMGGTSPGFDGLPNSDSAERGRASVNGCQIVALTGLGSENSRQEAFSSGTNLFLTKPVKLGDIRKVLSGTEEQVRRRESVDASSANTVMFND